MNPPNQSGGAPLTNKLILLMLTGIFVCLVMLVIRAFDRPRASAPNVSVSVTSGEGSEPPVEIAATPQPSSYKRLTKPAPTPVISVTTQPGTTTEATEESPASFTQTIVMPPPARSLSSGRGASAVNVVGGPLSNSSSIVGTVTLRGTPPPEIPINFGPSCGKFAPPATTRHYVVGPENGLANVLVYVVNAKRTPVTGPGPLLDQIGCMYDPYVLGVGVNQQFSIRNSDPELHNVHAIPRNPSNKEFNFAQMAGSTVTTRSFDNPEVLIRFKCDVHPWMFAYVGVVDHPWFAITDTNGVYQIPQGLPAGRYRISAKHVKTAGMQAGEEVTVDVESGHLAIVNFQIHAPISAAPKTSQVARDGR